MYKTTKIILAVCAAAIVAVLGWFVLNRIAYQHPKVKITYITSEDGDNYITLPQIEIKSRSSMGVSEEWDNRYFEAYDIIDRMMQIANSHRDDESYQFDSTVDIIDGTTSFTLTGQFSVNGEEPTQITETFSLDYILTEDIASK